MELKAVLEALTRLEGPLEVRSDSTYVVNCFRDRWWEWWLARGWLNSQKKPVANRDLWEPLISAYRRRAGEISFTWVKGHGDDPLNDAVDRLAVEAALTQQGRSGDTLPGTEDLARAAPDSKQKAGAALARRDGWLGKHADEAIVVWDGKGPALGKLVRTLEDKLGEDVWIVEPVPG